MLPLLPAAANLARGMPFWHGPRGAIELFVREDAGGYAAMAWLALDLLIGIGAPALLDLAAVLRRTRRLIRGTALSLIVAAAVGAVGVLTTTPGDRSFPGDDLTLYPDGLFVQDGEIILTGGISALWYGAALLASTLILLHLLVLTHSDFDVCVTTETYTRRPPVETKGWQRGRRLLIMAFPGKGDRTVTYRKTPRRW
ncbi:hypothetical protein [Nonomuraea sp. GTA35]|uniref:hypothetical protein n=1 Tax=Nonomuraea sp. GTA35 TaxID=1676746 RepID=UPI0035C1EEDA